MKKQFACVLLGAMLCLSACSARQKDPSETTKPTNNPQIQPTQSATANPTQPSTAAPTQPPVTTPTTQPPETSGATQPSTKPVDIAPTQPVIQPTEQPTPPPATQPATQLKTDAVIAETVREIAKLMPALKFDSGLQSGGLATIPVAGTASYDEAVAELHDNLLSLFDYNLYLEQQENPQQVQPVIFDYTYNIRYLGREDGISNHVFEVCYVMNKQTFVSDIFDSDEVIRQVTQAVAESTKVKVTPYEENIYTRVVVYDDLPYFYSTQQSVDRLVRTIENEIYGENLGIVKYTQFRLVFHSKGETAYTFLLYLR